MSPVGWAHRAVALGSQKGLGNYLRLKTYNAEHPNRGHPQQPDRLGPEHGRRFKL